MARQQTEAQIKHLGGLSKIRAKVSMYLGSSDGSAMWTALREALDNTIDEANQGRNDYVHLVKDPKAKWGYWIIDHGGGMPVKDIAVTEETTNKKVKISALKALVFLIHAGGKFEQGESEGGLRGCFVAQQRLPVHEKSEGPDGSTRTQALTLTFSEVHAALAEGRKLYAMSKENSGLIRLCRITHSQITKHVFETQKVYDDLGNLLFECTDDHPVFEELYEGKAVKEARYLANGDVLVSDGQAVYVGRNEVEYYNDAVPVYGLTVEDSHQYLVCSPVNPDLKVLVSNTHGVGIKALNAVSNHFKVWTLRDKKWYHTAYEKGVETEEVGPSKQPSLPHGIKTSKGTVIYTELDPSVFDKGSKLDEDELISWFETTSAFVEGVTLKYTDAKGETQEWEGQDAETTLLGNVEELKANLLAEDAYLTVQDKLWDLGLAFTDYDGLALDGYASGLYNQDGGTHVQTVFKAISDVVSQYAKRGHSFNPTDLREGVVGFINIKLTGVKFHNQEKTKLVDERAGTPLYEEIYPVIEDFFKRNKALATTLCERASRINDLKADFKANKAVLKVFREQKKRSPLPTKLVSSLGCSAEERELFLVEGDSAGGCFEGKTEILLSSGETISFEAMVEGFLNGKDYEVMAYDVSNRRFVPARADFPRQTKKVSSLLELTFDNGFVVRCTPDHKFLTDKGWVAAEDLTNAHTIVSKG